MADYVVVQDRIHAQWKVERRSSMYNYWHIATYSNKRAAMMVADFLNEHRHMETDHEPRDRVA